jgi:hypothetical protein
MMGWDMLIAFLAGVAIGAFLVQFMLRLYRR